MSCEEAIQADCRDRSEGRMAVLDDTLLQEIFRFVGKGHYRIVAGTSRRFRSLYRKIDVTTSIKGMVKYSCFEYVRDVAASQGWITVLQWLRTNHPSLLDDPHVCAAAARDGNLMALQWARQDACPRNASTCSAAASGGNMEVLQWARQNGCPWDKWTCILGCRKRSFGGTTVGPPDWMPLERMDLPLGRNRWSFGGATMGPPEWSPLGCPDLLLCGTWRSFEGATMGQAEWLPLERNNLRLGRTRRSFDGATVDLPEWMPFERMDLLLLLHGKRRPFGAAVMGQAKRLPLERMDLFFCRTRWSFGGTKNGLVSMAALVTKPPVLMLHAGAFGGSAMGPPETLLMGCQDLFCCSMWRAFGDASMGPPEWLPLGCPEQFECWWE